MYNRHRKFVTYYEIVIASAFSTSSSDNQHRKSYNIYNFATASLTILDVSIISHHKKLFLH